MQLTLGRPVPGAEHALGDFRFGRMPFPFGGEWSLGSDIEWSAGPTPELGSADVGPPAAGRTGTARDATFPVFHQLLDPAQYFVAFEPGSPAHQVLSNDQNRFPLPRALPPIVEFLPAEDEDNDTGSIVITRHAYSDGAFALLENLLEEGHQFTLSAFLELAASLAEALAFLHDHGIVHGQWHARAVWALPAAERPRRLETTPGYRFELFGTGVCARVAAAVPEECIARGYYPHEVYVGADGVPDPGAIDLSADVYCFAAFLRDLLQRSCSTEDLPSQAGRLLEELQRRVMHRGEKATPEQLRRKELEILDHLYTIKLGTESLIQEGMRERELRAQASDVRDLARDLHDRAEEYFRALGERGFAPLDAFGEGLQHYTAFAVEVDPARVNSHEDARIVLRGAGLPVDVVRVTLNERHRGVHVVDTSPDRIELQVSRGFPQGRYRIAINNRRTNGTLDVIAPTWIGLEPTEVHQPWPDFPAPRVVLEGRDLPVDAEYALSPVRDEATPRDGDATGPYPARVRRPGLESDGAPHARESVAGATEDAHEAPAEDDSASSSAVERVEIELPAQAPAGAHELLANRIATGLRLVVHEAPPTPRLDAGALEVDEVANHCTQSVRVRGWDFHPDMVLDLGPSAPAGVCCAVEGTDEALLTLPAGTPPGRYALHLNHRETDAVLRVVEPRWEQVDPSVVRFPRRARDAVAVTVCGHALPAPQAGVTGGGYGIGRPSRAEGSVLSVEVVEDHEVHRLRIAPVVRRGRGRLRFAGADTGLAVRVRRPLSRAAQGAIGVLTLALVAVLLAGLARHFAPRLTGVEPDRVFTFGTPRVVLSGNHVRAIELLAEDGRALREAVTPLDAAPDTPRVASSAGARYALTVAGVPAGHYRLQPVGVPLLTGAVDDELVLTVVAPRFRVEPSRMHRLAPCDLELSAAEFPIDRLGAVTLVPARSGSDRADVIVGDGRRASSGGGGVVDETLGIALPGEVARGPLHLPAGLLPAAAEGTAHLMSGGALLTSDDRGTPLTVQVVGCRVDEIVPAVVTADPLGAVAVELDGTDLLPDLDLALIPASGERLGEGAPPDGEAAPEAAAVLAAEAPAHYAGHARPGRYRLAWSRDGEFIEAIPDHTLTVLPAPHVTAVEPRQLDPAASVTLVFRGVNLAALDRITLRPISAGGTSVELPVEPDRVHGGPVSGGAPGGEESLRVDGVRLPSGSYLVEPAAVPFAIEVFDDCHRLLSHYREERGDTAALVACLSDERPTDEVLREAADLLFDRGEFAAAGVAYGRLSGVRAEFRAAFVASIVGGGAATPVAIAPEERDDPFAIAAARVGFAPGEERELPSDVLLPWDLEFVRGATARDPADRVAGLRRALDLQRRAHGGERGEAPVVEPFPPARRALASALLELARLELSRAHPLAARRLLELELCGEAGLLALLAPAARAEAEFWRGHLAHWIGGDDRTALRAWQAASRAGAGPFAARAARYAAALGVAADGAPPGDFGASGESSARTGHDAPIDISIELLAIQRDIARTPNFNLLTERLDLDVYLPPADRERSAHLHSLLRELEAVEAPEDPFAVAVLLLELRAAQRASWPAQPGGALADDHRVRLRALPLEDALQDLREVYIARAEIAPLDATQIAVWPAPLRARRQEELAELGARPLPASFQDVLRELGEKISTEVRVDR